jgi:hypothetical protein
MAPKILHSHDEPFVIDNSPLGIDVGKKHAQNLDVFKERGEGKEKDKEHWVRRETDLDGFLLLRKKDGVVQEPYAASLSREPIVFDLIDKSKTTGRLTLEWDGKEKTKLRLKTDIVELDFPKQPGIYKRRLQQDKSDFRILRISGKDIEEFYFPEELDAIFVVFHALSKKGV